MMPGYFGTDVRVQAPFGTVTDAVVEETSARSRIFGPSRWAGRRESAREGRPKERLTSRDVSGRDGRSFGDTF